jgi:enoyl-CoA hydratase
MGLHSGMDAVFGLHHLAHSHNAEVMGDSLAGMNARRMRDGAGTEGGA